MKTFALFVLLMPALSEAAIFQGHAVFEVKPEHVAAFQSAVDQIVAPTRKEPGNISYEYQRESNRFEFKELWVSKDAMMVDHRENTPHMREFFAKVGIGTSQSWVESFVVDGKELKSLSCGNLRNGSVEVRGREVQITVLDPLDEGDSEQVRVYNFDREVLHQLAFGLKQSISVRIDEGFDWMDGFHVDRSYSVECRKNPDHER